MIDEAMTTADVQRVLKVKDPDTIYALVRDGKLPAARLGREYRFDPEVVRQFMRGEKPAALGRVSHASSRRRPWMDGVKRVIQER